MSRRLAMATAQATGWPRIGVAMVELAALFDQHAGDALADHDAAERHVARRSAPLAMVIRSGLMPKVSQPNHSPVRPKPQMTSSATSRMP